MKSIRYIVVLLLTSLFPIAVVHAQTCPTMKIVKFGPSIPGEAGTDPMPIKWQFDVTSVTRQSAGNYIVNFTTPFSSADSYACTVTAHTGSNGAMIAYGSGYPNTASSFRVATLIPDGTAFADPYFDIEVICAGN